MAIYNLTNLTATNTTNDLGNFVCQVNSISNQWWAIVVLFLIFLVAMTLIMNFNYTFYTALPISTFLCAVIASLFRFWQCNGNGMIPTTIVIMWWVFVGLSTAIRSAIKE
jgi:hypothetical protein